MCLGVQPSDRIEDAKGVDHWPTIGPWSPFTSVHGRVEWMQDPCERTATMIMVQPATVALKPGAYVCTVVIDP